MRQQTVRQWWLDRRGTTSIEYALIASLVSVAIVGALQALGGQNGALYQTLEAIVDSLKDASS